MPTSNFKNDGISWWNERHGGSGWEQDLTTSSLCDIEQVTWFLHASTSSAAKRPGYNVDWMTQYITPDENTEAQRSWVSHSSLTLLPSDTSGSSVEAASVLSSSGLNIHYLVIYPHNNPREYILFIVLILQKKKLKLTNLTHLCKWYTRNLNLSSLFLSSYC